MGTAGATRHPVEWLRECFAQKKSKNPAYSIRAFSKYLDLPSGRVSEVLARKRNISLKMAKGLLPKLMLMPHDEADFMQAVLREKSRLRAPKGCKTVAEQDFQALPEDAFHLISDWYHYGILSLMKTDDFQSNNRWIAKRLGLSVVEVAGALERLERLQLIVMTEAGWQRPKKPLTTSHDVPSSALRRSHLESLERAKETLMNVPVMQRDITSITAAIDPRDLPEIKQKIAKFRREMLRFMERGAKQEVFELNIQLVPLSIVKSTHE